MRQNFFFLLSGWLLALPLYASAQQAEIKGRVVEFGSRDGIAGVTVELDGVARRVTSETGQFSFSGIPTGTHRLSFRLIGYANRDLQFEVRGDTTLLVELDVAPVRMDTVNVQVRNITVRGRVYDPVKQIDVVDAEVRIGTLKPTWTNAIGNFKVSKVPSFRPLPLEVRAIGYLPIETTITATRDTTVRITVEMDPLGQRFIAAHMAALEIRGRSVPLSRLQFNEDQMLYYRGQTVWEFIRTKAAPRGLGCIMVDDVEYTMMGQSILESYLVEEVRRIEIYGRGTMVRLYTARHLQKNIGRSDELPPILLIQSPGGLICR